MSKTKAQRIKASETYAARRVSLSRYVSHQWEAKQITEHLTQVAKSGNTGSLCFLVGLLKYHIDGMEALASSGLVYS